MIDAALQAIANIFGPPFLWGFLPRGITFLVLGALLGLVIGFIPGLSGVSGLALILPLTFEMDATAAIALSVGLLVTLTTSDTAPAILFAVPGTNSAQATILDGHALAKQGQAARALGAAYFAAMLGGIVGGVVLALSIPFLRPLVLMFGSAEFFMLAMLGVSMVAVLSGKFPLRGLVIASFGFLLGMVGADPQAGVYRWTFGSNYLVEGLPIVPIALGLFALPEIVDMCIRGKTIATLGDSANGGEQSSVWTGIRDTLRHWFLVVRCSIMGTWIGAVPGLSSSVIDWIAYGHALQTEKGARKTFGKGDIRGVIAPESAVNAKDGGGMIPTIAFGIPASAGMALFISILLIQGVTPGPAMLTTNLSETYTLIWSLVLANVVGTAVMLLLGMRVARLATLPIYALAAFIIPLVFLASIVSGSRSIGDIIVLLAMGALGWVMKRLGWSRPVLLLAFILSPIIERYFYLSTTRYGWTWLGRPIVLIILAIIVLTLGFGIFRRRSKTVRVAEEGEAKV